MKSGAKLARRTLRPVSSLTHARLCRSFLSDARTTRKGLYLMGRAHAGLGDQQEAASSMQACIDAVKTAPAYKYRAEKRWLHEAQQFLKGKKREAVSSER